MRILSYAQMCLGTLIVTAGAFGGCSSSNNPPVTSDTTSTSQTTGQQTTSTNTGVGTTSNPTSGTTSPSGSGSGTTGTTTGTTTTSGAGAGDAGLCPSTLKDKVTTCTVGTDMPCVKGCGPDLPAGSPAPGNLGTKTCTCTTGVYQCAKCAYPASPPLCYQVSASAAACAAGVADKTPCTTPCTTGTGNDVCTMPNDAGTAQLGCVCVTVASGNIWSCATLPWM